MSSNFIYTNVNPLSEIQGDCVTRAISLASGRSYADISDKLYYISKLFECDTLCVCCYHHLLDSVLSYPRLPLNNYSVSDLARKYPNSTIIARLDGHLTCIKNGNIRDLWDCGDLLVDIAWLVQ